MLGLEEHALELVNGMDDFDAVLNFEASHFTRGDADGRRDAVESGELRGIGAKSGFMKGLAYGLEVGFYRAAALERLTHEAAATSAAVASSSSPSPAAAAATNRPLKWASQLSQRADAFPTSNVAAFDFDNEVRELRGLFRLSGCAAQVGGPFRPPTSTTPTANNDVVAAAPAAPPVRDNMVDPGAHVFTSLTPAAFDW